MRVQLQLMITSLDFFYLLLKLDNIFLPNT